MMESGEECNDSLVDYRQMNEEWRRLATYLNIYLHVDLNSKIKPLNLAKNGLFYNERFSVLICFSCRRKTWVAQLIYLYAASGETLHLSNCNLEDNAPITVPEKNIYELIQSQLHEEYCLQGNLPMLAVPSALNEITDTFRKRSYQRQLKASNNEERDLRIEVESMDLYNTTEKRLVTFKNWPASCPVSAESVAKAGFIYLGKDDRVQCYYCNGIVRNWEPDDVPILEHIRHFPDCSLAKDMMKKRYPSRSYSSTSSNEPKYKLYISSTKTASLRTELQTNSGSPTSEQIVKRQATVQPSQPSLYNTVSNRMITFQSWSHPKINPLQLCLAGFYHTGEKDECRCFQCDVLIDSWLAGDDPYKIHAKKSPDCSYIIQIKGQEYVYRVAREEVQAQSMLMTQRESSTVTSSLPVNADVLKYENEKLKDERQCVICMSEPKSILILPCAHIACCATCIKSLKKCPVCRSPIKGTVKTFMS